MLKVIDSGSVVRQGQVLTKLEERGREVNVKSVFCRKAGKCSLIHSPQ